MQRKFIFYVMATAIIIFIIFMLKDSLTQPGIDTMKVGFKEVAKYRNANNTGPIQRIYVVTLKDSIWKEFKDLGNSMPHTKYGNTKVYFFMAGINVPTTLHPGEVNFDPAFNKFCIALYEKSAMSQVIFNKYPFK